MTLIIIYLLGLINDGTICSRYFNVHYDLFHVIIRSWSFISH